MNWELILLIVSVVAMLLMGGFITRLVGDFKGLIDAVSEAISDGEVNDAEIAIIIKRGKVLGESIREITRQILNLRR